MNSQEINAVLRSDKVVKQFFAGVFSANNLPKINVYPTVLVANLDPDTKPGSHWVAVYFDKNGVADYFDSYGRRPYKVFQQYGGTVY